MSLSDNFADWIQILMFRSTRKSSPLGDLPQYFSVGLLRSTEGVLSQRSTSETTSCQRTSSGDVLAAVAVSSWLLRCLLL
jgi:hypothetical protein